MSTLLTKELTVLGGQIPPYRNNQTLNRFGVFFIGDVAKVIGTERSQS
jgi:hypothetical protein